MKTASILVKPASSLCNMRCSYCFYADVSCAREVKSYGIMQPEISERILRQTLSALSSGDALTIAFQGGEPTLAGLDYFRHFIRFAEDNRSGVRLHYSLQTNGLLLDADWCDFLAQHRFLVGLSFDLFCHDENRPDAQGQGTMKQVLAAKKLLEQYKIDYNILCVLTAGLARHPQKAWRFLEQHDIRYVQFIPCLEDLAGDSSMPQALTPQRFAQFYRGLLPLWRRAFQAGNYRSVKLIDDTFNLFRKGRVTACGQTGQCAVQMIVEADGSVYPCDFYVLDGHRLGSLARQNPAELLSTQTAQDFLTRTRTLPDLCTQCPYRKMCGGGCRRMERAVYVDRDGGFCGYRDFLDACLPILQQIPG
ncbi:MAG: SPASM domain-containing protein [Clostridiales bacterium]|nr:SPASM domain-containing protein [Clostridiales bacterium]